MDSARRNRSWLCLLFLVIVSCDDTSDPGSTVPEYDLTGLWSYSYQVASTTSCPDRELVPGCAGGGMLDLVQTGRELQGSTTARSGCHDCSHAWDYGSGQVSGAELSHATVAFTINGTRLKATIPSADVAVVNGIATRTFGPEIEARGTWTMTRAAQPVP